MKKNPPRWTGQEKSLNIFSDDNPGILPADKVRIRNSTIMMNEHLRNGNLLAADVFADRILDIVFGESKKSV